MTAMTKVEASTSTFGRADASRTAYCKDVAAIDDQYLLLFDFMDPVYIRVVQNLPTKGAVKWKKGGVLSSLSYDYYGTTTYETLILLYNGYIAASKIPAGAVINIPDVSSLKASLQASNKGKVVRI